MITLFVHFKQALLNSSIIRVKQVHLPVRIESGWFMQRPIKHNASYKDNPFTNRQLIGACPYVTKTYETNSSEDHEISVYQDTY